MPRKIDTVKITVTGSYIGVGLEQYKPIDAHFQPMCKVLVEIPASEFVGWEGKGRNKAPIVTMLGYFLISEMARIAAQKAAFEITKLK